MSLLPGERISAASAFYDTVMELAPQNIPTLGQRLEFHSQMSEQIVLPLWNTVAARAAHGRADSVAVEAFAAMKGHPRLFGRALAQTAFGKPPGVLATPLYEGLGVHHHLDRLARQAGLNGQARVVAKDEAWTLHLNTEE